LKNITLQKEIENLHFKIVGYLGLNYKNSKLRAIESLIFKVIKKQRTIINKYKNYI